jgi:hypothetical protein
MAAFLPQLMVLANLVPQLEKTKLLKVYWFSGKWKTVGLALAGGEVKRSSGFAA